MVYKDVSDVDLLYSILSLILEIGILLKSLNFPSG